MKSSCPRPHGLVLGQMGCLRNWAGGEARAKRRARPAAAEGLHSCRRHQDPG